MLASFNGVSMAGPRWHLGEAGPVQNETVATGKGSDPHVGKDDSPGQAVTKAQERRTQGVLVGEVFS